MTELTAEWIWHPPVGNKNNFYCYLRKKFVLPALPRQMMVHVAAVKSYELYINGQFVGRGPSPAMPDLFWYDTYEVTDKLVEGENAFCSLCYSFGVNTKPLMSPHSDPPGFFLQAEAGGDLVIGTDTSWKVKQAMAWRQDAPFLSTLSGGYKEYYDATQNLSKCLHPDYDDTSWLNAVSYGPYPNDVVQDMWPREIVHKLYRRMFPVNVFVHSDGWINWGSDNIKDLGNLAGDNDAVCTVIPDEGDLPQSIILDFGETVSGYLTVRLADSWGGRIDVAYAEHMSFYYIDRLSFGRGPFEWRLYNSRYGRYIMLTFTRLHGPITIEGIWVDDATTGRRKGMFKCSDPLLNKIWYTALRTLEHCTQEHYEDCPMRERVSAAGDCRVEALLGYYAFGNYDFAAKIIRQFASRQKYRIETAFYGVDTIVFDKLYTTFPAEWVTMAWDNYWFSCRKKILEDISEQLERLFDWVEQFVCPETGLIRFWDKLKREPFIDWDEYLDPRDCTALQCIYYKTLCNGARIMGVLGRQKNQKRLESWARRLKAAINKHLWCEEQGTYYDGMLVDDQHFRAVKDTLFPKPDIGPDKRCGEQATVYALLTGVAEGGRRQRVLQAWRKMGLDEMAKSPYMMFNVVQAMFKAEIQEGDPFDPHTPLGRIRTYWGGMLERGATSFWERFDPRTPHNYTQPRNWSYCHGYAAGPLLHFPAGVLGIVPLEPGFTRFAVKPHFGDLKFARGKVPTSYGDIHVDWFRKDNCYTITIKNTKGLQGEFALPSNVRQRSIQIYLNGKPVWKRGDNSRPIDLSGTKNVLLVIVDPGVAR